MRKVLSIIIALVMAAILTGCGKTAENTDAATNANDATTSEAKQANNKQEIVSKNEQIDIQTSEAATAIEDSSEAKQADNKQEIVSKNEQIDIQTSEAATAIEDSSVENSEERLLDTIRAQYIRTDGYVEGATYPVITLITSKAELTAYCNANSEKYSLSGQEFTDACNMYDDAYFENLNLILILLEEGSGSTRHEVTSLTETDGKWTITITRDVPAIGTCDMAEWHIFLEPGNKEISDANSIKIEFVNKQ